jgi:hypothetical protein
MMPPDIYVGHIVAFSMFCLLPNPAFIFSLNTQFAEEKFPVIGPNVLNPKYYHHKKGPLITY